MEFGSINQKPNCNMRTWVEITFPLWYERRTIPSDWSYFDGYEPEVEDYLGLVPPTGSMWEGSYWEPTDPGTDLFLKQLGTVKYEILRECEMKHPSCPESDLEIRVVGNIFRYAGFPDSANMEFVQDGYVQMEGKLRMMVQDTCEQCDVPDNPYGPSSMGGYPTTGGGGDTNCGCRVGEEVGTTTPDQYYDAELDRWCTVWTRVFEQKCFDVTNPDNDPGHSQDFNDAVNEANAKSDNVTVGSGWRNPDAQDDVGDPGSGWNNCGTEFDPQPCDPGGDCFVPQMGTCCSKRTQATAGNAGPCCPNIFIRWTDCPGDGDWVPAAPAVPFGGVGPAGPAGPAGPGGSGGNQPFSEDPNCPRLEIKGTKNISINTLLASRGFYREYGALARSSFQEFRQWGDQGQHSMWDNSMTHRKVNPDSIFGSHYVDTYVDLCYQGDEDTEDTDLISRARNGRFAAFLAKGIELILFEEVTDNTLEVRNMGGFIVGNTWMEALKNIATEQQIHCKTHRGWAEMQDDLGIAMCRGLKCEGYHIRNGFRVLEGAYDVEYSVPITYDWMSPYTVNNFSYEICKRRGASNRPNGEDLGSPKNCP